MTKKIKRSTEKETQIARRPEAPVNLILAAVKDGTDLDKVEKLLMLQERWEANEARKSYHKAMASFKANPPEIFKDKSVNFGQGKASYRHASLSNVCKEINKALSPHGLSSSWRVSQNGKIEVICKITHALGHSEETALTAPSDKTGSKNEIQAIGSTITYLERYTLLALVGLATADQDDDAQVASADPIDEKQLGTLIDYLASTDSNEEKFLKYMGVPGLEEIPKSLYKKAINALKVKELKK